MTFTALSIKQPWAWLIARPDLAAGSAARAAAQAARQLKDCENRDWETPVRGWVLLHASAQRLAKWDYQAAQLFAAKRGVEIPGRGAVDYGAIVGAARVDDCRWGYRSPWYLGPRAFVFGATAALAPVVGAGALRFFQIPGGASGGGAELAAKLERAVRAAGLATAFRIEPGTEAGARGGAEGAEEKFNLV